MKKQFKQLLSLTLAVVMLVCIMCSVITTVGAAGDTQSTATDYSFGTTVSGTINADNTKDFYRFVLPTSGRISVNVNAAIRRSNYYLYDENGNEMWKATNNYWNESTEMKVTNVTFNLTKGEYRFLIERNDREDGAYTMKTEFVSANESFTETAGGTNNSYFSANEIAFDTEYLGQIAKNDDKDFYKLTLPASGTLTLDIKAGMERAYYYLYDENYNQVWNTYKYWDEATEIIKLYEKIDLTSGLYYLLVERYNNYENFTGNYSLKTSFETANESFAETTGGINNKYSEASEIQLNTEYRGQLANNDDKDFYKFTLPEDCKISIDVNAGIYYSRYYLYNDEFNEMWKTHKYWDSATNTMSFSESIELTAGTYYFLVERESTGNYDFSITSDANKPTEPTTDPDTQPGTDPKPSRILGDVDGDKSVKIKDATLIQKYLADIYTGYDIGSEF